MFREILLACSILTSPVFAVMQHISYTGGVQSGTFTVKGTRSLPGVALPDTVLIDSALRVVIFTQGSHSRGCGFNNLGYWFFLDNVSRVGLRMTLDTVWTNATTFPTTALWVDTLRRAQDPISGAWEPGNLAQNAWGIKVGEKRTDEICVPYQFVPQYGFRRVVYFSWMKSGQTRYGKLMARQFGIYASTGTIITHPTVELDSVEVSYMLFDSASLDPTPMSLRSLPPQAKAQVNLLWSERDGLRLRDAQGRLYNLHGRRLPAARP